MAAKTRFKRLHTPKRVELVERIAMLALEEEDNTGKAILYATKYEIGNQLGVSEQLVSLALRLSYTAEFAQEYGYSFVPPGNGRSGDRHGYILATGKSKETGAETQAALTDTEVKLADHLRGIAQHWQLRKVAHGGDRTRIGKRAGIYSEILNGAAAQVEGTLDQNGSDPVA